MMTSTVHTLRDTLIRAAKTAGQAFTAIVTVDAVRLMIDARAVDFDLLTTAAYGAAAAFYAVLHNAVLGYLEAR